MEDSLCTVTSLFAGDFDAEQITSTMAINPQKENFDNDIRKTLIVFGRQFQSIEEAILVNNFFPFKCTNGKHSGTNNFVKIESKPNNIRHARKYKNKCVFVESKAQDLFYRLERSMLVN